MNVIDNECYHNECYHNECSYHNECYHNECYLSMNVITMNVITMNVITMNVISMNVITMNVITMNVITMNVITMNVINEIDKSVGNIFCASRAAESKKPKIFKNGRSYRPLFNCIACPLFFFKQRDRGKCWEPFLCVSSS